MNLIIKAAQFARDAHAGQTRKYTNAPYITHPGRVAAAVSLIYDVTEDAVAAAWLHDVIEDTAVTPAKLGLHFNDEVVHLVMELTNPSKGMKLNRETRKRIDRDHIAASSYWARVIKVLDRIDNLKEIAPADGFTEVYMAESELLIDAIANAGEEPIFGGLFEEFDKVLYALEAERKFLKSETQ